MTKQQISRGSFFIVGMLMLLAANSLRAQDYPPINDSIFANTRWQFTYSSHVESDEVVFRAEDGYDHYIWFKYNNECHTYFNSNLTVENWYLNEEKTELSYSFSRISKWKIAAFTKNTLVLEFSFDESAAYRYHFVKAGDEQTPFFEYEVDEFPEVEVNRTVKGEDPHPYRDVKDEPGKRLLIQPQNKRKKRLKEPEPELEYMQIELVGGGFFGGPNPTYRNHLVIKTDGRVIRELQTEKGGLQVWKSNISRKHLEELIEYIEKKNFFEMEQIYACESNACLKRMADKPRPIALRLAVTKGSNRKVVTVSIFEGVRPGAHFVNFPPEIKQIVKALEDVTMMAISH